MTVKTSLVLLGHLAAAALATGNPPALFCPPLGPVLPAPLRPSADPAVRTAVEALEAALRNQTADYNGTAVSVAVQSVHEEQPLLNFHYTPPRRHPNGTDHVDEHTVFRIGSLSKVFTVLGALLAEGVRWDDPVTRYLPELRDMPRGPEPADAITTVDWDDVTIGSLPTHMSGIGTDLANDMSSFRKNWTQAGLPDAGNATGPACGGLFGLPPCSRAQFFRDFGKRHPVYAPYTTVVYSNVGISLLGFVLETVSGRSFADYMRDAVTGPLGLNSTTTGSEPVAAARAFIPDLPQTASYWGVNLGYPNFAGGFYSTTSDLLAFGRAILSSRLLSPAQTRRWLKPATSTSQEGLLMGAPWEIYRTTVATRDGRLVELYTKSGDVGVYHAKLCLVPDYGLAATVLTAGPQATAELPNRLCSDIARALLPATEHAGRAEAATALAGTYTDSTSNSSLALALDDGPGFAVRNWTVRGVDVLRAYPQYGGAAQPAGVPVAARLYPSGLAAGQRSAWRVHFDGRADAEKAAQDAEYAWPRSSCTTWAAMDRSVYLFNDLGEFVFTEDEDCVSLELRGFRVDLKRE